MTQNGITFNSVKTGVLPMSQWPTFSLKNQEGVDEDGGIINAVEIDWNGADWSTANGSQAPSTINTTGDLINAIKYASQVGGGGRNKI